VRPHGRASVSSRNPRAFGICDRCGFLYNHNRLQWQFDYAGAGLINKRILVCNPCNDVPQAQLRAIVIPADPIPIQNPRVQDYAAAETDNISTNPGTVDFWTGIPIPSTTDIVTQDGINITTQVLGKPTGFDQNAIMPLFGTDHYGVPLYPLSVSSATGTSIITVTFSSAHGLVTGDQISVQGLTNKAADGMYSVTVSNPLFFTYQVNSAVPTSSNPLLTSTSLMVTALVGLPYNYNQIPITGV